MRHDKRIDEAVRLFHLGDVEMSRSDTAAAAKHYAQAGDLLTAVANDRRGRDRRDLLKSACVAYYQGGHYLQAVNVSGLDSTNVAADPEWMGLYTESRSRQLAKHGEQVMQEIKRAEETLRRYPERVDYCETVLALLRDNPHVYPAAKATKKRVDMLDRLGRHVEADLFREDLARLNAG